MTPQCGFLKKRIRTLADFKQAIAWMKEGKKIRRRNEGWYIKGNKMLNLYGVETGNLCVHQEFSIPDFEATDWEIYEEPKTPILEKKSFSESMAYLKRRFDSGMLNEELYKIQVRALLGDLT